MEAERVFMPKELEITKSLEFTELKNLANVEGPCITIYTPTETAPNTTQLEFRRLKSAIQRVDQELRQLNVPESRIREFTGPMQSIDSEGASWGGESGTLVIFRSPDVFRVFQVAGKVDETVVVGDSFYVFPLIHALQRASQIFYLLALSQNRVRLLRCTDRSSEEVDFPPNTPRSLQEWLNTRMPNAAPERGEGGVREANEPIGSFTSTQDRDNKDEHVANFFRVIEKVVFDKLRDERYPLVLCGVDHMRAMYKSISQTGGSNYRLLLDEGVSGSPESLKGPEMHARALKAAQEFFSRPARKALELWHKVAGTERALAKLPEIVKAAYEGRIAHLFAAADARTMGAFDRDRMEMVSQGRQQDVVNASALQTLAFGGDVFILKREDLPAGGQLAAITRY
jgi:release factor family 3